MASKSKRKNGTKKKKSKGKNKVKIMPGYIFNGQRRTGHRKIFICKNMTEKEYNDSIKMLKLKYGCDCK